LFGDEDLNSKVNFVIAIVGALIISVVFNLHYYVNLRREDENVLHNMRARALAVYGGEVSAVAYFLEGYLDTLNLDLVEQEVAWGIARTEWAAEICTQGLSENSGSMYYKLYGTARELENYFVWQIYGPINTTKVEIIAQALSAISDAFAGFDLIRNKDPLEALEEPPRPGVDTVINYCQQIQEIVR